LKELSIHTLSVFLDKNSYNNFKQMVKAPTAIVMPMPVTPITSAPPIAAPVVNDSIRQARLLMGKQVLCLFFILCVIMIPFIVCDYYYSKNASCRTSKALNTALSFTLGTWMQVKASTSLGYLMFILLAALVILMTERYNGFLNFYSWFLFVLGLFRLTWMIIGSIMFWGHIFKRRYCTSG
jgi:hypothetical protein